MKIAIIGSGNVGGTLGVGWAAHGHDVIFGVRNVDSADIKPFSPGQVPIPKPRA